jgi:tetratricopeptide (TPR) repeat protein
MPNLPALRNRIGSLTLGLAIIVLIALLCLIASLLFATRFVEDTIKFAVDNIANRSGLSVFLVRGSVILATIPFFWAVGQFTKNIWGLINLGWDSMSLYKSKYGRIIVVYVAVYFLALYWASLQAYDYKYCADTPEGIWTSDGPGKDPIYGIELKSCSMDQKLALREGSGHIKPPSEIGIRDAEQYKWFDPVTGRPLVWYSVLPSGAYRFFDGRGRDPHNGQELKPITAEIVERVQRQLSAQAIAEKQAAEAKRNEDAARDAAAQQAQKDSENAALVSQGQSALDASDYKSAINSCDQVLKASPDNRSCRTIKQHASVKLAEQVVTQGQDHFEKGEFDEALWSAEKALELDPTNQSALKLKKLATQMKPHALQ